MPFIVIPPTDIVAGQPVDEELLTTIKNDLDYLNSTLTGLGSVYEKYYLSTYTNATGRTTYALPIPQETSKLIINGTTVFTHTWTKMNSTITTTTTTPVTLYTMPSDRTGYINPAGSTNAFSGSGNNTAWSANITMNNSLGAVMNQQSGSGDAWGDSGVFGFVYNWGDWLFPPSGTLKGQKTSGGVGTMYYYNSFEIISWTITPKDGFPVLNGQTCTSEGTTFIVRE